MSIMFKLYGDLKAAISSLFKNWFIAIGCFPLLSIASLYLQARFMPILVICLCIGLMVLDRSSRNKSGRGCLRLNFESIVSLTLLAFAMFVSLLIDEDSFGSPYPGKHTPNPFFTILLLGPATVLSGLYFRIRARSARFCVNCKHRACEFSNMGLVSKIIREETLFQGRLFLMLSAVVTATTWTYYLFFYVDVNVNKSDMYFLTWMPLLIYLFSLLYLWIRYKGLVKYYLTDPEMKKILARHDTTLRFLIISNEKILLKLREHNPGIPTTAAGFDTPAEFIVDYRTSVSNEFARSELIEKFPMLCDAQVRYMYDNTNFLSDRNLFHFCAFTDGKELPEIDNASWFSLGEIAEMIKHGMVSVVLRNELRRLYTIAITAKTYDAEGKRRYKTKHYKPTFRLSDLNRIDVDYNDLRWIDIARINQDSPFFNLKKIWGRIAKGSNL